MGAYRIRLRYTYPPTKEEEEEGKVAVVVVGIRVAATIDSLMNNFASVRRLR